MLADSRTQKANSISGIEIENGEKVLMAEIFFGIQSAPFHQGVSCANGDGIHKGGSKVVLVIFR
ncbi:MULTISPECIES: hypothetical protein [unclassified Dehalobacter]|uniref:hypothetical protein n=1 Tax=unclassified Dehalobacter TaxID=2635733 RepID=UPI001FA7665F|nr:MULTISPECIES: hypothetical protein [unclassified Dehalobacter]MDJ0304834.1 hypothetical protein [Dehalobacter sp.]